MAVFYLMDAAIFYSTLFHMDYVLDGYSYSYRFLKRIVSVLSWVHCLVPIYLPFSKESQNGNDHRFI